MEQKKYKKMNRRDEFHHIFRQLSRFYSDPYLALLGHLRFDLGYGYQKIADILNKRMITGQTFSRQLISEQIKRAGIKK